MAPRTSQPRGAATVEFAFVVPVLVIMVMASMYFTELVHAKLKLQEASRYAAWQLTSYILTDYAKGNHDHAFDVAQKDAVTEAVGRFRDLDSVEDNAPSGFVVDYRGLAVTLTNQQVPLVDTALESPSSSGGLSSQVAGAAGQGLNSLLSKWGFNAKGEAQAEVAVFVESKIFPHTYLEEGAGGFYHVSPTGDVNLSRLAIHNRFSLIATGWDLADGSDAMMRTQRAGMHTAGTDPHGIYLQVTRMKFLGILNSLNAMPGVGTAMKFFQNFGAPALTGTFVVAHNYQGDVPNRDCSDGASPNPSPDGLNNLDQDSVLDWNLPRCFDTAPFRDVNAYANSLYVQMFQARGPFFMGCPNAQADDPTSSAPPNQGDSSRDQTPCANH